MRALTFVFVASLIFARPADAQSPVIREAKVFGALPHVSETAISPNGRMIAQIQRTPDGGRAIAFIDLGGELKPVGVGLENGKARSLRWVGDGHVMLLVSDTLKASYGKGIETFEIWRWFIIDKEAKTKSIPFRSWRRNYFYSGAGWIKCIKDGAVVMAHQQPYSLYSVELSNGSEKLVESGDSDTFDWILNSACDPIVRLDYDQKKEQIELHARKEGGGYELKSAIKSKIGEFDAVTDLAVLNAEGEIAGLAQLGDLMALRRIDTSSGEFRQGGEGPASHDVSSTIVDPFTNRIVGFRYIDDLPRARYLVEPLNELQSKAAAAIKGGSAVITSWSRDYARVIVEVTYPDHPDQTLLFEPKNKSMSVIGSSYPALDGREQPKREKYDYVASDGVRVPGYLTEPVGAKSPAPLIVLPHGGPAARDNQGFDWWASFYASNGYRVYQPNFRGSYGYGEAFRLAGDNQWGRKMQDDISEGVRKLVADGIADPKRICIVGASYGGYAALAGATLTPDLYACAVSVNGVSNLPTLIASENESSEKYWTNRIGSIFKDKVAIAAISPEKQVSKSTPPVLLLHATNDIIVPPGQSLLMKRALERAGRPAEHQVLEDEDHWLSNEPTRIEMLEKTLAFINKHIGIR
jgi:dienelactone hydrolase